jgi:crotonobetainyl-CoA:carnitine CoA-transferase CaiB-like acyl-CoA transferase
MVAILEGIRVVELAQFVFVPAAGAVLSSMGADVIKVEDPKGGDKYRGLRTAALGADSGGIDMRWQHANRGKRSVGIDLRAPGGREVLLDLIEAADVFLTNFRPDALRRNRLDVEALRERNPRLIYARGTGYGVRGPDADRAGYDASAFWSRGSVGWALTATGDGRQPGRGQPGLRRGRSAARPGAHR